MEAPELARARSHASDAVSGAQEPTGHSRARIAIARRLRSEAPGPLGGTWSATPAAAPGFLRAFAARDDLSLCRKHAGRTARLDRSVECWLLCLAALALCLPSRASPGLRQEGAADAPLAVGTGAVGAFYGSRLHVGGAKVSLVCRSNYKAIASAGLVRMRTRDFGDYDFRPHAVFDSVRSASAPGTPTWDYVVVTTKALPDISDDSDLITPLVDKSGRSAIGAWMFGHCPLLSPDRADTSQC